MLIKSLVLKGWDYIDIQAELGIPEGTWDAWTYRDQHGFREKLNKWKKERMIRKAEKMVETLIYSEDDRVKLNASTFILETQAKDDGYSKRSELTGADGKELNVKVINYGDNDPAPVPAEAVPATAIEGDGQRPVESSSSVA
jgi:hypothetical protein